MVYCSGTMSCFSCKRKGKVGKGGKGLLKTRRPVTHSNGDISMRSDPYELLQLCGCLYDEHSTSLQLKVIHYLTSHTGSESAFLLFVSDNQDELSCKVAGNTILEDDVKFDIKDNSFSTALKERRDLSLDDIKQENCDIITNFLGISLRSLLCIPILHPQLDKVVMIACLVNKDCYTPEDKEIVLDCCKYVAPLLVKSRAFEEERRLREQCQSLLCVARNLFTHLDNVTLLLKEIMTEARNLTKAERCSLFLLDKEQNELVAKVFDGNLAEDGSENTMEVRIPADQGIAGHVATTGKLLNIHDAYSHPLFYKKMDETTGFKTRNILCFPIQDEKGVLGVAELCNKINGHCFSYFDEELASAFSIYCAISIMHSLMWKKVRDAQHRSRLSNELMMYHMQVCDEEVLKLAQMVIPSPNHFHENFSRFNYTPRSLTESDTPLAVLSMLDDMGMIYKWRIPRETLAKFVMMVRRGYRDPPYHNWMHAFSVGHFCYLLLKNLNLMGNQLTYLEGLALFVACLCHDLDHRGTTNSFQVASKSVLAALYSSEGSVMERHHFAQAMAILNTDGCNIFENLSKKQYTQCLDNVRDVILATDLAHHLRIITDIEKMLTEGYNSNDPNHHELLLCLLVTSCDLSDQTKDWRSSKKIAELIYREFFSQGDLEKAMGVRPSEMMDREKACIPELQISFIQAIVVPVYQLLVSFFPEAEETVKAVTRNKIFWERIRDIYKRRYTTSTSSLDILEDEKVEQELLELQEESSFEDSET